MLVKDLVRARSRFVKAAWMAVIERTNLAHASGIHVTSAVEEAEIKAFGFRLQGRIFDVPNGVVVQAELPQQQDPRPPYLVMLGRIHWKKRIDLALEVVQRVDGIRLVIAGGDDDDLAVALRERSVTLGIGERVEFVGQVDGSRKRQLLQGALALLMPSLSENFGNSALEAMAEGTPVIVAPQVGIADSVRESGSGFVAAPSAEAFADAVRQLQTDRDLRTGMGARARATVAAKFSWDAIGVQMENEYRAILEASHRIG
jgi:glycosyltransferase involved in cell wall biosynthesis